MLSVRPSPVLPPDVRNAPPPNASPVAPKVEEKGAGQVDPKQAQVPGQVDPKQAQAQAPDQFTPKQAQVPGQVNDTQKADKANPVGTTQPPTVKQEIAQNQQKVGHLQDSFEKLPEGMAQQYGLQDPQKLYEDTIEQMRQDVLQNIVPSYA